MKFNESGSGGIGLLGLLATLFIGLKLTNYITWSWWWVTLPLWGGAAAGLGIISIALLIYYFAKK